jgi:hypothetical protein
MLKLSIFRNSVASKFQYTNTSIRGILGSILTQRKNERKCLPSKFLGARITSPRNPKTKESMDTLSAMYTCRLRPLRRFARCPRSCSAQGRRALRSLHRARVAQRALRVHGRHDVPLSLPAAGLRLLVARGGGRRRGRGRLGATDRVHEGPHGHVVLEREQRLERGHDVAHGGPRLGHALQALVRHPGRLLRGARRVLHLQARVHEPVQPVGAAEVGARPVHEVLLAPAAALVHGAPPREQLQEHNAEAVHVALRRQVARQDVLRRRVPVGAHHARRHVRRVPLGALLGQPEIRKLRGVVLEFTMTKLHVRI